MNPQIIYTRPASDLQTVVTLHLEGRELVRRDASGVRRSSATVSNILPIAELCATGHHPRAALDPFARRDHVNIRHISIQRDHMGQEIERLELEGEARTLEELEASFKQLPQTPLVKSWSAAVTSELKEQLTPDAWAASGLQAAETPYSSQSSASDKTDASSSLEQPSAQVSEPPQPSEIQLPTAPLTQALLREILPFLITSSGLESKGSEA